MRGTSTNGTVVAARVEIGADGLVRISAPDVTNLDLAKPDRMEQIRQELGADLASGWDGVQPAPFDFDGTTFRKPGGLAPQIDWDKNSNTMLAYVYLGTRQAVRVPLHPVANFSDNPWPS